MHSKAGEIPPNVYIVRWGEVSPRQYNTMESYTGRSGERTISLYLASNPRRDVEVSDGQEGSRER